MPYGIKKVAGGYKVESTLTGKVHSKKHLTLAKAHAQMRAMYAAMKPSEKKIMGGA